MAIAVLSACSDENIGSLELVDPESDFGFVCTVNPLNGNWDGTYLQRGESKVFQVNGDLNSTLWTSSDESVLSITSNPTSNSVTVRALDYGCATLSFSGNSNNGSGTCSKSGTICVPQCNPVNSGCLSLATEGCSTAFASISPGCYNLDIESIDWTWSLGSFNDIPISNPNSIYNVVLNIPTDRDYDNYNLVFKATINYNNGCPSETIWKQKTLDCPSVPVPIG